MQAQVATTAPLLSRQDSSDAPDYRGEPRPQCPRRHIHRAGGDRLLLQVSHLRERLRQQRSQRGSQQIASDGNDGLAIARPLLPPIPLVALDQPGKAEPDPALVDLQMPPPGGMAAIEAIAAGAAQCATIVLSGVDDPVVATAALRAGAQAYLVKSAEPDDLIPAIQSVLANMSVIPNWLREHLVAPPAHARPVLPPLSSDETKLLRLLARGHDTAAIAEQLHVSVRTAKRMISAIVSRLGVKTRVEAAVLATAAGLVVVADPAPARPA